MVFNANEHPKMIKKRWLWTYQKKTTMQYCCVMKQENKKYKVVYLLFFRDMSFHDNDSISFSGHSSLCMQYLYN